MSVPTPPPGPVRSAVLVEVERDGLVESRHHGAVVALAADGDTVLAVGDVHAPMYPRSSNKLVQATAMVRAGLPLREELLALAAASHSGEDFHQQGVRRILEQAGLTESALQNTPRWPMDDDAARAHAVRGGTPSAITADCSGKHAAMLLTAAGRGWDLDGYLDPGHPVQQQIEQTLAELAGEPVTRMATDGCGAPLHAISLTGLARSVRALATAAAGTPEAAVAEGVSTHPAWVSGRARDERRLIDGVPGLIAKAGAEAVYVAALPDGRTVALKIEDGGSRARSVVMAAALLRLGVRAPVLDEQREQPVLGGGREVGRVHPVVPVDPGVGGAATS